MKWYGWIALFFVFSIAADAYDRVVKMQNRISYLEGMVLK